MISTGLIVFFIVLFIVALVATFYALKQEENKQKRYEEAGVTPEEELKRSFEYERKSLKSNVPVQVWIYTITITLSLVIFAVYVYK